MMVLIDETQRLTVLVVDDSAANLELVTEILKQKYSIKAAINGKTALKIAQSSTPPDLILLDVMMPEMNGYEVCKQLKQDPKTANIPVIYITGQTNVEDEVHGLELGAVDYITKPIFSSILLARVNTHLTLKKMQDFLADQNELLEAEVIKRTAEIVIRTAEIAKVQDVTILALASLAETRDTETGDHLRRTQHYIKLLAKNLRLHPRFVHFLNNDDTIEMLFKSAPLHDIGKVGIPDSILLKTGSFDMAEFEIMKTHTTIGRDTILQVEHELGVEVPFLKYAKEIAYSHQEKWDGSGYPEGLAGDEIPISARLMAVADVYDALRSHRVYKKGMSHEEAIESMTQEKGTHFDPDIVDALVACEVQFKDISLQLSDRKVQKEPT